MGLRSFTPMVTACPGLRAHDEHVLPGARRHASRRYLRAQMPAWRARYPGVENMHVAVMGCVVNGPGESKHANIGISLPGTGEKPVAPVYVDGEKTVTLKGERIAEEFQRDRRATTCARPTAASRAAPAPKPQHEDDRRQGRRAGRASMAQTMQAVRGMNDVLPDEARAVGVLRGHGARRVRAATAIATSACRSSSPRRCSCARIGEVTDIVEKEMYTFDDR